MKVIRFWLSGWRLLAVWLCIFSVLMGFTLNNTKPFKGDESFYITSAIEMVRSGNYLEPVYFGELRMQKPILPYWITVAGYLLFGISLWSGRLPFLVLSVLLLLVLYYFVRHVVHDEAYAFLSVTLLSSSLLFLGFTRHSMSDLPFTFFITLSLFSLYLALEHESKRRWWFFAGWVAASLACLSKFILGAAPLVTIAAWLAITRPRSWKQNLGELFHPFNIFIFTLILLPWYILIAIRHTDLLLAQSGTESAAFMVSPIHIISNAVFYLFVLIRFFAPFTIIAAWLWWRRRIQIASPMKLLIWFCILVFFVFVLFIDRQRERYLLIIFPALTVLMTVVFYQSHLNRPLVRIAIVMFAIEALGFIVYPVIAGEQVKELVLQWRAENLEGLSMNSLERRKMSWVQALTNGEANIDNSEEKIILTGEEWPIDNHEYRILHENERISRVHISGMKVKFEKQRYYLLERLPVERGQLVDEQTPANINELDMIGTVGK